MSESKEGDHRALERRVLRKVDLLLMPILTITLGLQYYDKAVLGNASLFGINQDLVGHVYSEKLMQGLDADCQRRDKFQKIFNCQRSREYTTRCCRSRDSELHPAELSFTMDTSSASFLGLCCSRAYPWSNHVR